MRFALLLGIMLILVGSLLPSAARATARESASDWRGFTKLVKPVQMTDIAFQDSAGRTVKWQSLRGRWVLLNLWARWCAPCVEELPSLLRLQSTAPFPDLFVLALSTETSIPNSTITDFLADKNLTELGGYQDSAGTVTERLMPRGLPSTYLVNPRGQVVAMYMGAANWGDVRILQDLSVLMN